MSDFTEALRAKINDLSAQRDDLEEKMANLTVRIDVLLQLIAEEGGNADPVVPKKRGRPKKSKVVDAETDSVLLEASQMEGTDPEIAERLRNRRFEAAPRPMTRLGPGIIAGAGRAKPRGDEAKISDRAISVDDDPKQEQ
jgi:seryl-tRNA synthetase